MADVNGRTLMMAVQAVDAQMRSLQGRIDAAGDDDDVSDDEELLLSYEKASLDLRAAYEIARVGSSNLPPYERLVKAGGS